MRLYITVVAISVAIIVAAIIFLIVNFPTINPETVPFDVSITSESVFVTSQFSQTEAA